MSALPTKFLVVKPPVGLCHPTVSILPSGSKPGRLPVQGVQGPVWQSRYWEHHIRDDTDLNNHIDYIHANPFTHGYVKELKNWPYSYWHRHEAELQKELHMNRERWKTGWSGEP